MVTPEVVANKINNIPLEWKEANIIPLFKKGSRNKSVNYRPVSLTSVICKVLETIIRDHMMDFLIKHKLINPSQHVVLCSESHLIFPWLKCPIIIQCNDVSRKRSRDS